MFVFVCNYINLLVDGRVVAAMLTLCDMVRSWLENWGFCSLLFSFL